ncbi:MAG: hypothetical protein ACF8XB_22455 [Planctomycetota bacterium JB042]
MTLPSESPRPSGDRGEPARDPVDTAAFRAQLRSLDRLGLLRVAFLAIERLPEETWPELLGLPAGSDVSRHDGARPTLLEEVRAFHGAVLRREFHVELRWTSQTFDLLTPGTEEFVAEFERLSRLVLEREREGGHEVARIGLELLLDLVKRIDADDQDLLCFMHDVGSDAIGLDVEELLDAQLRSLAATAEPREFALEVGSLLDELEVACAARETWWERAAAAATGAQEKALRRLVPARDPRR